MKKLNIAVLIGGKSSEREVSLETAENVIENLDRSKYNTRPILITKENKWTKSRMDTNFITNIHEYESINIEEALNGIDVSFIAMHGEYGEDGALQGLLEFMRIPYTGSGVLASALAMDKIMAKELFRLNKILTPSDIIIRKENANNASLLKKILDAITPPLVVKPVSLGSSVGVSIIENLEDFPSAIDNICRKLNCDAILEEYIRGREVTCGILENYNNQRYFALPITEIVPVHKFFNYEAKYDGTTREITPADLTPALAKKIQETAIKCHKILGCEGYSRTDMIIKDGQIYVLELNTLPGLTQESLLPKAAAKANLTLSKLLDIIINNAVANH